MSELEERSDVTSRSPRVITDIAAQQRETWTAEVIGPRETIWLERDENGLARLREALGHEQLPAAFAWPDGLQHATSFDEVVRALHEVVERDAAVVVAVPNTRTGGPVGDALALGFGDAQRLARELDGTIVEQHLAEAAVIGARPDRPLTGTVVEQEELETDEAVAWLVVAGSAAEVADARLQFAARPVHRAQLAALELANAELLHANTRLARANLGRHDAGAASLIAGMDTERQAVLAELASAQAEIERLEARLALEVEVAARNDRFFQETRAILTRREHRIAAGIVSRLKRIPGARLGVRVLKALFNR
jgi:hypothetical protein